MTHDPYPWAKERPSLHEQVWSRLNRGVRDRRAPTRHPTLTTVTPEGRPQARTVVLRAVDRVSATLDIHTDLQSAKIADLRATPFAALHVWDQKARLQIRLDGEVAILTGAEVADIWARMPEASRMSYGGNPAPGQPIDEALAYRKHPNAEVFAVVRLSLQNMDILHLGPEHRRASFSRSDDWAGQWLAP